MFQMSTGVGSNIMTDAKKKQYLSYSPTTDSMLHGNHGYTRHYRPPCRAPYRYQHPPRGHHRINSQRNFPYPPERGRSDNMDYIRSPVYRNGPRHPRYTAQSWNNWNYERISQFHPYGHTNTRSYSIPEPRKAPVAHPKMIQMSTAQHTMEQSTLAKRRMTQSSMAKHRMAQASMALPKTTQTSTVQSTMEQTSLVQPGMTQASTPLSTMEQTSLAQPRMTQSPVAKHRLAQTSMAQPKTTQLATTQPRMTQFSMAEPGIEQTIFVQSSVPQPGMTQTSMTQPRVTQILVTQPKLEQSSVPVALSMAQPRVTQSYMVQPTSVAQCFEVESNEFQIVSNRVGSEKASVENQHSAVSGLYGKQYWSSCPTTTAVDDEYKNKVTGVDVSTSYCDVQPCQTYTKITYCQTKFQNHEQTNCDLKSAKSSNSGSEYKYYEVDYKGSSQFGHNNNIGETSMCLRTENTLNNEVENKNHYKCSSYSEKVAESKHNSNHESENSYSEEVSEDDAEDESEGKDAQELLMSMTNRGIKISRLLEEQKRLMANLHVVQHTTVVNSHKNTGGYT